MEIKQVQSVSVFVSDQERALNFYTKALGLELHLDATYSPGYRRIEVVPRGAATGIALVKPHPGQPDNLIGVTTSFVLSTDDLVGTYAELLDRGVEFVEPPAPQPWGGMQAIFADLDGNRFVLTEG